MFIFVLLLSRYSNRLPSRCRATSEGLGRSMEKFRIWTPPLGLRGDFLVVKGV